MNELSVNYSKAVELDQKIKVSAQMAQQNLYDMCMGLKNMRDSKLYKELGYTEFNNYCTKEIGFTDRQVYNYIRIVENLPEELVNSSSRIGIKKLTLLSTLSEDDRTEITQTTDLENTTVKHLEDEIKQLKLDKVKLHSSLTESEFAVNDAEKTKKKLQQQIDNLEDEIEELKNRPIDVAVAEPTADERLLKETIKSLERENIKQNELLEETYRQQNKDAYEMFKREKETAISEKEKEVAELKKQLEAAKSAPAPVEDESKTKFKILLTSAFDGLNRLKDFLQTNPDDAFTNKTLQLIDSFKSSLEG